MNPASEASTAWGSTCPAFTPLPHVDVFSVDTCRPPGTLAATYYHGNDLKDVKFPLPLSHGPTLPQLPDKHSTACFALIVQKDGKKSFQPLLPTHKEPPRPLTGSVWLGFLPWEAGEAIFRWLRKARDYYCRFHEAGLGGPIGSDVQSFAPLGIRWQRGGMKIRLEGSRDVSN
jgi:hypothetical protein